MEILRKHYEIILKWLHIYIWLFNHEVVIIIAWETLKSPHVIVCIIMSSQGAALAQGKHTHYSRLCVCVWVNIYVCATMQIKIYCRDTDKWRTFEIEGATQRDTFVALSPW